MRQRIRRRTPTTYSPRSAAAHRDTATSRTQGSLPPNESRHLRVRGRTASMAVETCRMNRSRTRVVAVARSRPIHDPLHRESRQNLRTPALRAFPRGPFSYFPRGMSTTQIVAAHRFRSQQSARRGTPIESSQQRRSIREELDKSRRPVVTQSKFLNSNCQIWGHISFALIEHADEPYRSQSCSRKLHICRRDRSPY
jgi:hypothetical protein